MGKAKNGTEDMEVVENKNVPGNGLTDTVSPEEVEPLRKKGGLLKGVLKKENSKQNEKIKLNDDPSTPTKSDPPSDPYPDPDDPGPSVSDNESDGEGGRRNRRQRKDILGSWAHKCRLTPKRGLIYLIFCALVIFILFFILVLLAALWPSGPSRPTCQSSQCHLFSSQIIAGLNSSSGGPCHDFWEFSCGGWLEAHSLPKSKAYWDVQALEERKLKDELRTLLNTLPTTQSNEPNSVALKMKRFYDSCTALEYIETDEEKPFKRVVKQLGGWNVLRDFRPNDFDFPRTLRKLHGEHMASPFFHVGVVPDPRDPSRNIIKITPAGLSLPHKSNYFEHEDPMAEAFRTFARDVTQLLGATSYQGSQFSIEIFHFEKRIAEVTPEPKDLKDPITSFHKVTVRELKAMSNTIFWGDLLKALFPQGNVNDQTEVFTTSNQYLMDISSIISTTDKGNLNNYIMWHLTQKYLPYLSKQFTEANEMFRKESLGSTQAPQRWEYCVGETIKYFPHATDYLLSQSLENRANRIAKIDDMFDKMRQNVINRVSTSTKFDDPMRNFLSDKLRLMTIQIGTPIQNHTLLKEIYFSLEVQKNEFFVNVQSVTDFQIRAQQKYLAHPSKDAQILNAFAELPFEIQFLESLNKVIVPESILQRDILDLGDTHLPLLFGSIGVQISHALAMSFSPEQGLFFSNGVMMSERDPKAQELRDMIESKRTCFASFFTNIRLDDEPYIEQTSLDTTMHAAGIQIALDTLKTHDASELFQTLPGLVTYSPEALFFLAYGQSQCSVQTIKFHDLEHTTFTSLSHDHRVKGVLRQMTGFTEAFECSKSSEMYSDFTCGYIL